MAISLASDILSEALSYLDTYPDLYSALLVNRYWSKNAVRRLWKDPFPRMPMVDDPKHDSRRRKLVTACLSFLPIETRIQFGLVAHQNQTMLSRFRRIYNSNNSNSPSIDPTDSCTQSPIFEYFMYTRRLRLEDVAYAVWVWSNASPNPNAAKRKVWQVIATLWSFLMQRVGKFENVSIDLKLERRPPFDILRDGFVREEQLWFRQILVSTSSHRNVTSKIFCQFSRHVQLLSQVSVQCSTIRHLSVVISKNCLLADELAQIVKNFTTLKTFKLSIWKDGILHDDDLSLLLDTLGTCDSLTSLDLEGGQIRNKSALSSLVTCPKLRRIKLQNTIGSPDDLRPLVEQNFPKLNTFVLRQHDITREQECNHVCSDIIRVHGSALQRIEISIPNTCGNTRILETIACNCPSLKNLTIGISTPDQIQKLFSVFSNCPNLYCLKITECSSPQITELLLKSFALNWPSSLRQLHLDGWIIDKNSIVERPCSFDDSV